MLESKNYAELKKYLEELMPADAADVLSELEGEELLLTFRFLKKDVAAGAFSELEKGKRTDLVQMFTESELRGVVSELYADDTADLIEELPANLVKRILKSVSPERRRELNELLRYPENSAGSVMTTEYVSLHPEMTVGDSIAKIRKTGINRETVYTCYVTEGKSLLGSVYLKDMLTADDQAPITSVMCQSPAYATTLTEREEVAHLMSRYDLDAIPVVDGEGRMVGIVTFDDAMDVIVDEATEDMEIMAAITPTDESYLSSSVFSLFLHRIPWLLLLMVSATFTGMIISGFESALAAQVVLTAFIPMLMDTGGNTGSQSSVTVIRAISLGQVEFKHLGRVLWKELRIAALCALSLSAVCFVKLMLVDRLLLGNTDLSLPVALTVCATMALTVIAAKLIGSMLPMLAKKLGADPAVMASPFITTAVDAISLLIYFGIANALL